MSHAILVINDDGFKSPLLEAFLQKLKEKAFAGSIRVVVPAEEQSWISQAITRHRPIFVQPRSFPCIESRGYTVSGTPADCANLGIHSLYPDKPALVLSGINFGINAGLPFHMNSGTLGGASQAFLSGIPAVGFSAQVQKEQFLLWKNLDLTALYEFKNDFYRIAEVCVSIAQKLRSVSAWSEADLFSVNLPWQVDLSSKVVLTKLERRCYGALFSETQPMCFEHNFESFADGQLQERCSLDLPDDITTVREGNIAITPLCPPGYPDEETIARLKQKLEKS